MPETLYKKQAPKLGNGEISHKKPPASRFVRKVLGVSLLLAFLAAAYEYSKPEKELERLDELEARTLKGEVLTGGEAFEYCDLLYRYKDSIPAPCVCLLDGMDWNAPPESPEALPKVWEEVRDPRDRSERRNFRHQIYPEIMIGFDLKDSNGNEKPHWHRDNPRSKSKKDPYLDKDCNAVRKGVPSSHIYVKK